VNVDEVPKTATLRAGVVAVIGIFGLAWLGDSFIAAHKDVIVPAIGDWAKVAPWTFAFGLFLASVLLYSQAATTRALMPLGIALGIPPQFLIAMFPSVNGYFFIPTYGSLIAAINFDLSGTTKIGKYVLNHSFMIPGLVATSVAVPQQDGPAQIGPQGVVGLLRRGLAQQAPGECQRGDQRTRQHHHHPGEFDHPRGGNDKVFVVHGVAIRQRAIIMTAAALSPRLRVPAPASAR
jgi:hypothetical protein